MRRVLGIDPGSRVTGYGVIESDGRTSRHIKSGCIRTGDGELAGRLGRIYTGIKEVLDSTTPDEVAVEQVFMARNAASALILGHARGAAITAVVSCGYGVYEYSPRSIKQALVGTGTADKQQVQHMVRVILSLEGRMAVDASDALAVALCHAHTHTTKLRLGRSR